MPKVLMLTICSPYIKYEYYIIWNIKSKYIVEGLMISIRLKLNTLMEILSFAEQTYVKDSRQHS